MKNRKLMMMLAMTALAATVFVGCSSSESTPEEKPAIESSQETEEETINEVTDETEEKAEAEEKVLVDGTYRIEYEEANEDGFKTFLEITVQDGKMSQVTFDEVNENNELNVEDDEEDNALEEAFMEATSIEEFEQIIEGKEEAETFKALAAKLMEQMQEGNTETIVVTNEEN